VTPPAAAGLYVHIPFCLTRCGYCDFNTYAGLDHLKGGYVEALEQEASLRASEWDAVEFASVFFGGGTPTTLPSIAIGGLLDVFRDHFGLADRAEVTVESNPDTVDVASLSALGSAGVNRLSIGVQSFDPTVLAALERLHSAESARRAFATAREAGFDDVNVDLIFGANGETPPSWGRTLEEVVALAPEHVSAYALTIEPATALGRKVAAGIVPAPDPDLQADLYEIACQALGAAGFEHYEVSNWARPGHRSVHNEGYWEGRPYLGLGAGAHSYRDRHRWWNVRPPQEYLRLVSEGRPPIGGDEWLSDEERRLERLLLGLRRTDGVPAAELDLDQLGSFVSAGLAERANGDVRLTERGMFVANDVVLELAR
jgi:putative oxygen-independent coproporphyrinogen III oxidase